jgi:hypothetical protein
MTTPTTEATVISIPAQPRYPKPAWHRQPCPDCGKPLIFKRQSGESYRPHSETRRWNYKHYAYCKCGFEAMCTTPGKPVYPERKGRG